MLTYPIPGSKVVTLIEIDAFDLDKFINEQYPGARFDFAVDQESPNDISHRMPVSQGPIWEDGKRELEKLKDGKETSRLARTILTDLCNRGILPPGLLLVKVSW